MDRFRVLGIDPGLAETGYGVIEISQRQGVVREWDVFSTDSKDLFPQRLQGIYTHFFDIIEARSIRIVVLEDVFVLPRYPKAALQLGAVIGVLKLAASLHGVQVIELKPTEVKMALTGNGRANKAQVEKSVRRILGLEGKIESEHASDALALAVVGLSRSGLVRW